MMMSTGNSVLILTDNAMRNSDRQIAKNKMIANEAIVKPEIIEIAEEAEEVLKNEDFIGEFVTGDGDRYTCAVCTGDNKMSGDAKSIIVHLKGKHDLCLYICDSCGAYFKKKPDLLHHLEDHVAKEADLRCTTCVKIFTRLRLLCPNKKFHYRPRIEWICDAEPLLFATRPYICKMCNKIKECGSKATPQVLDRYNDLAYFGNVNSIEVAPIVQREKLMEIDKKLEKSSLMTNKIHFDIQFATREGNNSFSCAICKSTRKSRNEDALSIMSHLHVGHNLSFHTCDVCGNFFGKTRDIDFQNLKANCCDFKCEICIRTCSRLQLFRLYKHFHHLPLQCWKCSHCKTPFYSKYMLEQHISEVHSRNRKSWNMFAEKLMSYFYC